MPVQRHAGHMLGQARHERHGARDVTRLSADGVDAPVDDVLDSVRIDAGALDQRPDRMRAQIGRVDARQAAPAPSDRGTHGVHNVCLAHDVLFSLIGFSVIGRK